MFNIQGQKSYWLKYYHNKLECLFRSDTIIEIENYCENNKIKAKDIIEIIHWI